MVILKKNAVDVALGMAVYVDALVEELFVVTVL